LTIWWWITIANSNSWYII